jgi:hypothetical protein
LVFVISLMKDSRHNLSACHDADIAAYLDGELDAAAEARFAAHARACPRCAERLQEQRMLLCELDFMLGQEAAPPLPDNFAQLVTVRAQSDLRGVRSRSENRLALKVSAALGLFAFALIGGAWRETVWQPLRRVLLLGATAADFAGDKIYGSGAGMVVLSRNVSGHLFFHNFWQTALVTLLLLFALWGLARMVADYHRADSAE